jgi:hypothetical protein
MHLAVMSLHRACCAGVAVGVAAAVRAADPRPLWPAALALGGSVALTRVSTGTLGAPASGATASGATEPAPSRRRRPGYHAFVRRRLGSPRHPGRFAFNFLVRPLLAPSLGRFWWAWNPPYAYVLRYFVYAPLRARLPRRVAVYATFLASGLLLHDLPFNLTADWARGQAPVPSVTLLFAVLGALTLLSDALRLDLSRRPGWVRAAANLGWLAAAFALRTLALRLVLGR